jgi:hypothetical protein
VDPGLVDRYGPFSVQLRYRDLIEELKRLRTCSPAAMLWSAVTSYSKRM